MINKQMLNDFRADFTEAMKALEQKYGLIIELKTIHFGYDSFDGKLEAKEGASKEDVSKREFEKNCSAVGLLPEDYGQIFTQQGKLYKIIGIDLAKRKYPIIIEDINGKRMRCTVDFVRNAM